MYSTREQWLTDAAGELAPMIEWGAGKALPAIRIACGFPSTHRRSGALGETFAPVDSADHTVEVLIAPTISTEVDVLRVLLRQLCQAVASGTALNALYSHLKLIPGKPREIPQGGGDMQPLADALGPYPHATLSLAARPKAPTRLLKGLCPSCGYTIRLSQKWADKGMPTCPCGDTINLDQTPEA